MSFQLPDDYEVHVFYPDGRFKCTYPKHALQELLDNGTMELDPNFPNQGLDLHFRRTEKSKAEKIKQ